MSIDMLRYEVDSLERELERLENLSSVTYARQLQAEIKKYQAEVALLTKELDEAKLTIARLGLEIGKLLNK